MDSNKMKETTASKKSYHPPRLIVYGTIHKLTEHSGRGINRDNPGMDPTKVNPPKSGL